MDSTDNPEFENFMIKEGLDLLAAFRSIRSEELRQSIIRLIAAAAMAEKDARASTRG